MSQDGFQALQEAVVRALEAVAELREDLSALRAERTALEDEVGRLRARLHERQERLDRAEVLEGERQAIRTRLERLLESLEAVGIGERT